MSTMTIKNTSGKAAFFGYGAGAIPTVPPDGSLCTPGFYLAAGASQAGVPYSIAASDQFKKDLASGVIEVTAGAPLLVFKNISALSAYFGYAPGGEYLAPNITLDTPISVDSGLDGVLGIGSNPYYVSDIANDVISSSTHVTITATAGAGGSVSPNGVTSVDIGGEKVITITPTVASGYHTASVLVDGVSVGTPASYNFTDLLVNHTLSATFALNTYAVTFSLAGGTRTGGGALSQTIDWGTAATAPTFSKAGYRPADAPWDVAFTNIRATTTVTALYTKVWTATFTIGTHGTLDSGSVSQTIDDGASAVEPTYHANAGYRKADVPWSPAIASVSGDQTYTALYMTVWSMTMAEDGTGTITPAAGAHNVDSGVAQAITASATNFVNWTATGGAVLADASSPTTTVTLTANSTVTAHWSA